MCIRDRNIGGAPVNYPTFDVTTSDPYLDITGVASDNAYWWDVNTDVIVTIEISVSSDAPIGHSSVSGILIGSLNTPYSAMVSLPITLGLMIEDFETGDFSALSWEHGGDAGWVISPDESHSGNFSAKSGSISHNQTSELSINMNVLYEGELEFAAINNNKDEKSSKKLGKYKTVLNKKDLDDWVKKIKNSKAFAVDTETDSVDTVTANLLGISISVNENEGCYIPLGHTYENCPKQLSMDYVVKTLGSVIEENQNKAVGQNLKFDIPILSRHGINITNFLADTMLMSYVLNSTATRHGMDRLAEYYLNYTTTKYTDVTGTASKQISFAEVKLDVATNYAAEDADITCLLYTSPSPRDLSTSRMPSSA